MLVSINGYAVIVYDEDETHSAQLHHDIRHTRHKNDNY